MARKKKPLKSKPTLAQHVETIIKNLYHMQHLINLVAGEKVHELPVFNIKFKTPPKDTTDFKGDCEAIIFDVLQASRESINALIPQIMQFCTLLTTEEFKNIKKPISISFQVEGGEPLTYEEFWEAYYHWMATLAIYIPYISEKNHPEWLQTIAVTRSLLDFFVKDQVWEAYINYVLSERNVKKQPGVEKSELEGKHILACTQLKRCEKEMQSEKKALDLLFAKCDKHAEDQRDTKFLKHNTTRLEEIEQILNNLDNPKKGVIQEMPNEEVFLTAIRLFSMTNGCNHTETLKKASNYFQALLNTFIIYHRVLSMINIASPVITDENVARATKQETTDHACLTVLKKITLITSHQLEQSIVRDRQKLIRELCAPSKTTQSKKTNASENQTKKACAQSNNKNNRNHTTTSTPPSKLAIVASSRDNKINKSHVNNSQEVNNIIDTDIKTSDESNTFRTVNDMSQAQSQVEPQSNDNALTCSAVQSLRTSSSSENEENNLIKQMNELKINTNPKQPNPTETRAISESAISSLDGNSNKNHQQEPNNSTAPPTSDKKLIDQNNRLVHQKNELLLQIEALTQKQSAMREENQMLAQEKNKLIQQNEILVEKRETLVKEIESLVFQKDALAKEMEVLTASIKAQTKKANSLSEKIKAFNAQNAASKFDLNEANDTIQLLKRNNRNLKEDIAQRAAELSEIHKFYNDKIASLQEISTYHFINSMRDMEWYKTELAYFTELVREQKSRIQELQDEIQERDNAFLNVKQHVSKLSACIAATPLQQDTVVPPNSAKTYLPIHGQQGSSRKQKNHPRDRKIEILSPNPTCPIKPGFL